MPDRDIHSIVPFVRVAGQAMDKGDSQRVLLAIHHSVSFPEEGTLSRSVKSPPKPTSRRQRKYADASVPEYRIVNIVCPRALGDRVG